MTAEKLGLQYQKAPHLLFRDVMTGGNAATDITREVVAWQSDFFPGSVSLLTSTTGFHGLKFTQTFSYNIRVSM